MKSKLLKLKQMFSKYWPFIVMYMAGCIFLFIGVWRHSFVEFVLSIAYLCSAIGWHLEKMRSVKLTSISDGVMENNDKLITINKELSDKNKEQFDLIRGLISENKDLKFKLKNAKMETSRLRKKGGNNNE